MNKVKKIRRNFVEEQILNNACGLKYPQYPQYTYDLKKQKRMKIN